MAIELVATEHQPFPVGGRMTFFAISLWLFPTTYCLFNDSTANQLSQSANRFQQPIDNQNLNYNLSVVTDFHRIKSCRGLCGYYKVTDNKDVCQCDKLCLASGDCCPDYIRECPNIIDNATSQGTECSGFNPMNFGMICSLNEQNLP